MRYGPNSCASMTVPFAAGVQDDSQSLWAPFSDLCTDASGLCSASSFAFPSNVGILWSTLPILDLLLVYVCARTCVSVCIIIFLVIEVNVCSPRYECLLEHAIAARSYIDRISSAVRQYLPLINWVHIAHCMTRVSILTFL